MVLVRYITLRMQLRAVKVTSMYVILTCLSRTCYNHCSCGIIYFV